MVKIRLRRIGAKKQPSYRVVVADSRAPRDGRFIETIGFYNPRTEPPTIEIKEDRALHWLSHGAQPTEAVARFLERFGTMDRLARLNKGRFPAYPTLSPEIIKQLDKAGYKKEEVKTKAMSIQKTVLFLAMMSTRAEEWKYVGKDVKLGDAESVVMWWRPKGAKTCRVVFGDLKIRNATPEEMKKLPKAPPADKPAPE